MFRKKQNQLKRQKKPNTVDKQPELTLLEHLTELRTRLFWIVLVLVVTSVIGLQVKDQLVAIIMQPLHGQKLIYLTPGGGFSFIFTLSIYFGALFTIPVAIYQLFRFLQPIIGQTSRKFIGGFLVMSTLLAAAGAVFGYYVTIPAALDFLANFAGDAVSASLTAESYLNFVVTYIVGLALIFQLPLIVFIVDHIRPLPPGFLSRMQRPVIIGATVLAAVITPTPDAYNMMIVAVPIIAVFEIGALAVFLRRSGRRKQQKLAAAAAMDSMLPAEDPLADILEELKKPLIHHQPQPVPVPVEPSSLGIRPQPKKVDFIKHSIQPKISQLQPMQPTPRPVDGFAALSRQTPGRVLVPARQTQVQREVNAAPTRRPLRSIDGMTIAS